MEITSLEQKLAEYRKSTVGLAVVIVLNCSNTMTAHLILERLAAREVVDRVKSPSTRIGLVQYGNSVETPQELTLDHTQVNLQLVGLRPVGGNNRSLCAALDRAQYLFRILGPEYRRLVVLLSDTGASDAAVKATTMKNENIDVVCIGVGPNIRGDELMALASTVNHYYPLPSMDDLNKLFTPHANANFVEPSLEKKRVYETQASFILDFKTTGAVSVDFQQHDGTQWVTLSTKFIPSLKETSTVLQCKDLRPETEYTFRALIKVQSGQILTSSNVTVTTRKPNPLGQLLSNPERLREAVNRLKAKVSEFSQQLLHIVRIGIVGKVGNGKSSVTNSLYALFNEAFEFVNVTGVIGERSLTAQPMPVEIPDTMLEILDFFGWDDPDQYESDLKFLIQGLAPDTLLEGQTLQPSFQAVTENQQLRKFYGVFIVVSPAEVAQTQHLSYVQGLYDFINRQKLQPIILLTKCDQIDTELVEHPEFIYSSDLVDNYIQQLTAKKFPRGVIFPVISYFEPPQNGLNLVKDYLLLSALHALLLTSMKPLLIRDGIFQRSPAPRSASTTNDNNINEAMKRLSVSQTSSQDTSPHALHSSQLPPMNDSQNTELASSQNPSGEANPVPPPSNSNAAFVVYARRNAGNEASFKRCSLQSKTMQGLSNAICTKFVLSTPPVKIYALKPDGIKIIIEDDDDVGGLAQEATLEFV